MTAADLLADLRGRGVELARVGADRLRWQAPHGALRPGDLELLRTRKTELLDELERDGTTPVSQLEREWQSAWQRARREFATHGVEPSPETLEACARLELDLEAPTWLRLLVTREDVRALLQAVYRDALAAGVDSDGRVRIGSARAAGALA